MINMLKSCRLRIMKGSSADGNVHGDGENIYDKYFDSSSESKEEIKEEVVQ